MTEKDLINLQVLTNAYASEKIDQALDELEQSMSGTKKNVVYSRLKADKVIGKFIALAYAQGYQDAVEKIQPVRNIFM
jgi:Na+-translocating ferredoxin:NAD+ oxidoreductase RnfG subunit